MRRKGRIIAWQTHFGLPPPIDEPELELHPKVDARERMLVLILLRRYVTWCARTRRYSRMQGAANLYRSMSANRAAS